jgi:hypothetical protein
VASKPGVVVVVVDLVVLVGSVAGVVLVVVVVDLVASGPGAELVVVVVDLVTSGLGVVLVVVVVDLVSSAAALRAISIIVAISITTNIFFIQKPLFSGDLFESGKPPLSIIHMCFGASNTQILKRNPKFQAVQAVIPPSGMSHQIQATVPPG